MQEAGAAPLQGRRRKLRAGKSRPGPAGGGETVTRPVGQAGEEAAPVLGQPAGHGGAGRGRPVWRGCSRLDQANTHHTEQGGDGLGGEAGLRTRQRPDAQEWPGCRREPAGAKPASRSRDGGASRPQRRMGDVV